jgi:tRNA U34 5-methylaminomethyl-2-thiouridine-forming methyltransferase MnmC
MIQIRTTTDGSHTLFAPRFQEHYHSVHGAVQESMHVFINSGLKYLSPDRDRINILELGFGTGLNAFLTLLYPGEATIFYTGIEAYPPEAKVIAALNYPDFLAAPHATEMFEALHAAEWNSEVFINKKFVVKKICAQMQDVGLEDETYNLVYFDAFAPEVQPELWSEAMFLHIFNAMKTGGILVTYSAKGVVKRNLRAAGFEVKRLQGPPGKRHIIRAQKL